MEELLTVAGVARRLGIAPATLRTWDRRYGLGPTDHQEGAHRKYGPRDVARLMVMRRLIASGVSASDAAETALEHKGSATLRVTELKFEERSELVNAIYRSAVALDREFIASSLTQDIKKNGVIRTWQEVIVPVLIMVGDDWEKSGEGIEVEHLLTEIIKNVMREKTNVTSQPVNTRPVLLASVGEELHSLPLHALAAALSEKKIDSFFLGARTPLEALSAVVTRTAPPAIFLWAQLPINAKSTFFNDLPSVRPAPRVVLGGPGWNAKDCSKVAMVHDLPSACLEIERAVGL
jgi:MerR family transcriptional regulator, light-induced transcriptional regulator